MENLAGHGKELTKETEIRELVCNYSSEKHSELYWAFAMMCDPNESY